MLRQKFQEFESREWLEFLRLRLDKQDMETVYVPVHFLEKHPWQAK